MIKENFRHRSNFYNANFKLALFSHISLCFIRRKFTSGTPKIPQRRHRWLFLWLFTVKEVIKFYWDNRISINFNSLEKFNKNTSSNGRHYKREPSLFTNSAAVAENLSKRLFTLERSSFELVSTNRRKKKEKTTYILLLFRPFFYSPFPPFQFFHGWFTKWQGSQERSLVLMN